MERHDFKDQLRLDSFDGKQFQIIRNGDSDITDTDILIEFKYGSNEGPAKMTLKVGEGITKTDAVNGIFTMDAIPEVKLEVGKYYYDIKFIDGEKRKTYVYGYWNITQD